MPRKQKQYHYIYRTMCLITNKYYIGLHSTNNLNDGYMGSGRRLGYSIKKYGKENHKLEILEYYDDRKSLAKREKELVNEETIKDEMCMNICIGGGGGCSETTKAAMWRPDVRERYLIGYKNRVISKEGKENHREAMKNRIHSEEEKQKRSESLLLYYKNNEVSEEIKNILSQKSKELWKNRQDKEEITKKISETTKSAMWRPDVRERYLVGMQRKKQRAPETKLYMKKPL